MREASLAGTDTYLTLPQSGDLLTHHAGAVVRRTYLALLRRLKKRFASGRITLPVIPFKARILQLQSAESVHLCGARASLL